MHEARNDLFTCEVKTNVDPASKTLTIKIKTNQERRLTKKSQSSLFGLHPDSGAPLKNTCVTAPAVIAALDQASVLFYVSRGYSGQGDKAAAVGERRPETKLETLRRPLVHPSACASSSMTSPLE